MKARWKGRSKPGKPGKEDRNTSTYLAFHVFGDIAPPGTLQGKSYRMIFLSELDMVL